MIFIFGMLLIIIANQFIGRALRTEIDQRTLAITTNLSNAAAGHVIGKNIMELYALLTKYARLDGVAYAFIEDTNGQIVGHSMRPFPRLITNLDARRRKASQHAGRDIARKHLSTRPVYRFLKDNSGTAHLGIWAEGVKMEINTARASLCWLNRPRASRYCRSLCFSRARHYCAHRQADRQD